MKIRALLLAAAMLAPLAHADLTPAQPAMGPPLSEVYTSANARIHKVPGFIARAKELNQRRTSLDEEGKRLNAVRSSEKYKNPRLLFPANPKERAPVAAPPPSIKDYESRVARWGEAVRAFQKETADELKLRQSENAAMAQYQEARQAAIDAAQAPPMPMPAGSAPADPVAPPKPSSVPGLPPGVEPAKKAALNAQVEPAKKATPSDLPPGMTRR